MEERPVIEARGLVKRFGRVVAVDALDDYGHMLRIAHRVTVRGPLPNGSARPAET